MAEHSKLLKIISAVFIFMLLISLTGCYIFKPVSISDLSSYPPDKYHYVIKGKGIPFLLENPRISNGLLWGKADPEATFTKKNSIRIYPSPDYEIRVTDTLNTFFIPVDRIAKIKKSQFSILHTALNLGWFLWLFTI